MQWFGEFKEVEKKKKNERIDEEKQISFSTCYAILYFTALQFVLFWLV